MRLADVLERGYELDFEDRFDGDALDRSRWFPHHLPHWSSREQSAARYELGGGCLHLLIEPDQEPWCPEFDGTTRVSSLQTAVFTGQHRFNPDAVVREPQEAVRLYTPQFGVFALRARAVADADAMVALWMIGYEDRPERSAEICICEIFGRDVGPGAVRVGMGVHPFNDPKLVDDFARVPLDIDATEFHVYAAGWTPTHVDFFVNGQRVRSVGQSPDYPMQLMLGIYEFGGEHDAGALTTPYPKEFVVDYLRVFRPVAGYPDPGRQGG